MVVQEESSIHDLPDEIIVHIFQYLSLDCVLECGRACARWRKLVRDPVLWRGRELLYSGKPGQGELSQRNLKILSVYSEHVRCVRLQYVYNYPFVMSILNRLPNLTSLELVMCRVGADFQQDALRWPRLRKLNLKNSLLLLHKEDAPEVLVQFHRYPGLAHLTLSDFGLSSTNIDSLVQCSHLVHIFIDKIKDLTVEDVRLLISSRRGLQSLHIYGGEAVDDECLRLLGASRALRDLAVVRCERLTDRGLLPLAALRLAHLQIWNNAVFSEAALLSTLSHPNMTRLQSLSLSRVKNVSPVIVDVISEFYSGLKFLALYQCQRIINTDYEKQLKSKFRNIDVVLY